MKRMTRLLPMIPLLLITFAAVVPFYFMVIMGTFKSEELYRGIHLLPGNYLMTNFRTLFSSNYLSYFSNSIYIAALSATLAVLSSAMCGYAIAKFRWRMGKVLFVGILVTMMIPGTTSLVATVRIYKILGWMNTHYPLYIPSMAYSFGCFWMTQFIREALPDDILEAAKIDGAGEVRIFVQIVMPLLLPACFTLFLLAFVGSWNSFLMPLIVLNRVKLYTVPLGIFELQTLYKADVATQILGLSLSLVPLTLLFLFSARYFVAGLTVGAVKG